jgi:hypothetical protein
MKQFTWVFVSAVLYLVSCASQEPDINPKKLKSLLYEMHLAEALAQHIPKDSLHFTMKHEDSLQQYTADILKQHGVTEKQFQQSMDYYKRKPALLDSIYQEMLAEIAVQQTKLK